MDFKELRYLFFIVIIFLAACIETDLFLPALADMMLAFNVSEEAIQSLLTWNFLGVCLSCPFYGPYADAYGRKKPLLFALMLFSFGSVLTIFSPHFTGMLIGRILQGLGSGGCFTLGTAVLFDLFPKQRATDAMQKLNVFIPLSIAFAPMLGAYLNAAFGFRSNFIAIGVCSLFSLAMTYFFIEETLPLERRTVFSWQSTYRSMRTVLLSKAFWQTSSIVSLNFGAYFAFLSAMSLLFVVEWGVPSTSLPFYQGTMLIFWLLGNSTLSPAIKRLGRPRTKQIAAIALGLTIPLFTFTCFVMPESPIYATLPMILHTLGSSWMMGLYAVDAMSLFPDIRGITASLFTSTRLLLAGAVITVSSALYNGTLYPIAALVITITLISLWVQWRYEKAGVIVIEEESKMATIGH